MSDDGTREILRRMEDGSPVPIVGGQWSGVSDPMAADPSPIAHLPSSPPTRPTLRVIDNPGRIASTGLNAAIRAAQGQIVIRMDAHTDYAPDYLHRCVCTLQTTGADNVGGPARTKAETYLERAIAAAYHSRFSVGGARFHDVNFEGPVDTVTYGCWQKELFDRVGYFDEELVRNQDDEHNLRIIRKGGRIWQSPAIKSWYRPRGSLKALFQQYMQYGYWKVRVVQKHKLPASWRHLVPGTFVLSLALLFLLSAFCLLLSAFSSGWWPDFCFQLSAFCFVSLVSAYLLALLAASLHTAYRTEWELLPVLPLVFGCYHFGYGYGFLRGAWDFFVRRKAPFRKFETLTR